MNKFLQLVVNHPVGRYTLLLIAGLLVGLVAYRALAERPLWAYFTLAVIGLVPLALFFTNRRVAHLYGLTVIAALMAGVYLADELQENDREQVMRISNELMHAVSRADHATFYRYLANDYQWHGMNKGAMMHRVRTALRPNESRSCSMSSAKVNGAEGSDTLTVEGNLAASGTFGREEGFFSGTIELQYKKQSDGKYKVTGTVVKWSNGGEVTLPPGR